ncbi:MAG TPA: TIGR00725 family protein [Roseiflexaceae bacterium]|nr:TIGR00725 family protein [Roseiflexaceae bacterium]
MRKPDSRQPIVAVCGAGRCGPDLAALAESVGRGLAEAGALLVCGGQGGVMAAACQGARLAGGTTVGLLPGLDRDEANPDVLIPIATGLGEGRNLLIVRAADAVIAIGGEYGTLSEIALARKLGKLVVGLRTWELGAGEDGRPHILPAATPAEAVALALGGVTQP